MRRVVFLFTVFVLFECCGGFKTCLQIPWYLCQQKMGSMSSPVASEVTVTECPLECGGNNATWLPVLGHKRPWGFGLSGHKPWSPELPHKRLEATMLWGSPCCMDSPYACVPADSPSGGLSYPPTSVARHESPDTSRSAPNNQVNPSFWASQLRAHGRANSGHPCALSKFLTRRMWEHKNIVILSC